MAITHIEVADAVALSNFPALRVAPRIVDNDPVSLPRIENTIVVSIWGIQIGSFDAHHPGSIFIIIII